MQRFEEAEIDKWCEEMAREIAARLLRKVIKRTPVVSGDLRRGWTAGEEHVSEKGNVIGITGKNGFVTRLNVTREGNDYVIEIKNSVEYAPYVEWGHRTQDHKGWVRGRFILTKAEVEMQAQAPKILEKRLQEKLKELFNG